MMVAELAMMTAELAMAVAELVMMAVPLSSIKSRRICSCRKSSRKQ